MTGPLMNSDPGATPAPPRILLVEDNSGDEFLILDAFEQASYPHQIEVARDGEAAIERLEPKSAGAGADLPDLVLLDLNLPRLDGRDVLKAIKTHAELRHIPVLMLTTSSAPRDVQDCYDLHANAFLTKPFRVEEYENIVESIGAFWFRAATLAR
jgi:CheY-like chemotaxis protein